MDESSNRAVRLIYFLIVLLMGLTILFLCAKVNKLEEINSDWSARYQLLQYNYGEERLFPPYGWEQWQEAVESRDAAIEWYKSRPPKIKTITEIKEVPIEVIKYRNIFPRQFESVEQFEEWYEAQGFAFRFLPSGAKCSHYAERLQIEALKQGYSISQALTWWGRYYNIKVSADTREHAANLVLIADTYYYVEPHPEWFKIVKICDRD